VTDTLAALDQAVLEERARRLAHHRLPRREPEPGEEQLLVRVGTEAYGLPTAAVVAVARDPVVTPVPGAPAGWAGLVAVRSRPPAVLGLAAVLGVPGAGSGSAVVLVAASEGTVGLLVDEILGVERLVGRIGETPDDTVHLTTARTRADELVTLLDPDAVVAAARPDGAGDLEEAGR
jgi:chemotaxis signal transduction protein